MKLNKMKITKTQLKQIIREEIQKLNEDDKKKFEKVLSLPSHKGLKQYFDNEVIGSFSHKLAILYKIMKDDKGLKKDWAKA